MHAISHVTGGGLAGNLARVIPGGCEVRIDRTTWTRRRSSAWSQRLGELSRGRPRGHASTWASAWWRCCPPTRPMRRSGCSPAAGSAGLGLRLGRADPARVRVRRSASSATTLAAEARRDSRCARPAWSGPMRTGSLCLTTLTTLSRGPAAGRQMRGGRPTMGRGRAKAKQTKVARELKYRSFDTDFSSLEQELRSGAEGHEVPPAYADLAEEYERRGRRPGRQRIRTPAQVGLEISTTRPVGAIACAP